MNLDKTLAYKISKELFFFILKYQILIFVILLNCK